MVKYTDGKDIIEVTGKSPKGFAGVVFVAYRNGVEFLATPADIKRWKPLVEDELELVPPELPPIMSSFERKLAAAIVVGTILIYFLLRLTS